MSGKVLSAEDFPPLSGGWNPRPHELERRRRISVSVAAYAYEIADTPIMHDIQFDWLAQHIRPRMGTGHPLLDEFFIAEFSPMTEMWIHKHPELPGVRTIFTRYYAAMRAYFDQQHRCGKLVKR